MPHPMIVFARAALDRAQKMLTPISAQDMHRFKIAGCDVAFAESHTQAVNWIEGQFDPATGDATGTRLYCDYSGWHNRHFSDLRDARQFSPLEMDMIFAKAGLRGIHYTQTNGWDVFDPEHQIGIRLQPSPIGFAEWEPTAPFSNFLAWIMRSKGRMVLHAATLGKAGNGVLLAGSGGSGKSGTTLAGVRYGLESVGDDYCVIESGACTLARPFYRAMKQDPQGLKRVGLKTAPGLGKLNWQGKYVFDLRKLAPKAAVDTLEIKAILLPRIDHVAMTTLLPAHGFEVLQALAPSTMMQLGGDRVAVFKFCSDLVRQLPAFHLSLSKDPAEIAKVISKFISENCS